MDNEKGHTALHKAAAYKYVAFSQKMLLDIYSDFNVQQTNDEMIIFLLRTETEFCPALLWRTDCNWRSDT